MNDFKERMSEGLLKKPFDFFYYSMNDVFALQVCVKYQIFSCNIILKDIYKVQDPSYFFTVKNIPFSLGTLVQKFFTVFSQSVLFKSKKLFFVVMHKHSMINETHPKYSLILEAFQKICSFSSLKEISDYFEKNSEELNEIHTIFSLQGAFKYTAFQYSSISYLLDVSLGNNLFLTTLNSGGRTVNERPNDLTCDYGADIDIAGAYGTQLSENFYPLGLSRFFCKTSNETKKYTLGEFMKLNAKKFEKYGLFKIVVAGQLSFEQDLIYSRIS